MLMNNRRLLIFAKHLIWKNSADNTYCHLRTYRDKCKGLVQTFGYATKCDARPNAAQLPVDPRIEALREKLIYCDHLDGYKVRVGYLRRYIQKKRMESFERKTRYDHLVNVPAYSILLDRKRGKENDDNRPQEETQDTSLENEDATRPVHMPYASTDQYTDTSESNSSDKADLDELSKPLNEKYRALYEKYLAIRNATSDGSKELSLKDYLEETNSGTSYKTDLSHVPPNWMVDVEQYNDDLQDSTWLGHYGTPDPNSRISSVPCGGCGALLHCRDHAIPGYLPSELFLKKSDKQLRVMICQRCHFMKYYNTALEVKVSADEYPKLLSVIKRKKCAVILMVDLLDFPCSIWPEISSVLNPMTPVFLVGNKVDLLPQDSSKFFIHVKECLSQAAENAGIDKKNIRHIELISAKTGYGVEELINKLHKLWMYKGDVYVIGCTNVGKSSLFNALLQSDYCKVQAVDLVQRATISPWPGTTLNLLKFPILNPLKWRLSARLARLREERVQKRVEEEIRIDQFMATRNLKYATLQSRIGRTFQPKSKTTESSDPFLEWRYKNERQFLDENKDEYKYGRWCYDTPGTIQPDQVLDLLTTQELLTVLPKQIISPRTFILHANQTIFLGGIGRLDYLKGNKFIRCTIFSSSELPVTVTRTADADDVYAELLKTEAFVVPENNPERLKHWPALGSKEMEVVGIDKNKSISDVILSSAGWIAIAAAEAERVTLRAWSPQGRGLYLRTPALLSKSVALRGDRVLDAPTYFRGRQAVKAS